MVGVPEQAAPEGKTIKESAQLLPPAHPRFKPCLAYKDSGVDWLMEKERGHLYNAAVSDYVPQALINRAILSIPRSQLRDIAARHAAASRERGLVYLDDHGRPKTIELMLRPWILTRRQIAFYTRLSLHVRAALARLWQLYVHDPRVRAILPLTPTEESWVRTAWQDHGAHRYSLLGRLDSNAVYDRPGWRQDLLFLEPNTVGIGGAHYGPAAQGVLSEALIPALARQLRLRLRPVRDPRAMLVRELTHLLGHRPHRRVHVALIENQDFTSGTDEFSSIAAHLNALGVRASVADPRHLRLRGGQVMLHGQAVDVLYRDCELKEFIEMEEAGANLNALRHMVRRHRLVSSITAEFDHKSAWEVFTEPAYARYFTAAQRAVFHHHFLWTRLFREARVNDPSGRPVDLVAYTRRHQARLVLKPNHAYGGQGVTLGHLVTRRAWERTIARALSGRESHVVQRLAPVPVDRFPVVAGDGRAHLVERHVVSGFFLTTSEISFVGRFSGMQVVNVSRGGGLVAVFQAN